MKLLELHCEGLAQHVLEMERQVAVACRNQRRAEKVMDNVVDTTLRYNELGIPAEKGVGLKVEIPPSLIELRHLQVYEKFLAASMLKLGEKLARDGKTMRDWYFTNGGQEICVLYKDYEEKS